MSAHEVRSPISTPPMPQPRTGDSSPVAGSAPTGMSEVDVPQDTTAEPLAARQPDPEGSFRGPRPRTEYWDFRTASWRSQRFLPRPRAGE
jgi:hypothetical protein